MITHVLHCPYCKERYRQAWTTSDGKQRYNRCRVCPVMTHVPPGVCLAGHRLTQATDRRHGHECERYRDPHGCCTSVGVFPPLFRIFDFQING